MSESKSAMMMPLLAFKIIVILGVVTSQNHDVNSLTPYSGLTRRRSVEATTVFPPDPTVEDEGMRLMLTRLETLCVEKLSQSSSCQNIESLEVKIENLGKQFNTETQKTMERIEQLMNATRNLPSDVEAMKQNISSLINITRSLVDLSSNSELKQILNEGHEPKYLQTATSSSCPLNLTVDKEYPKHCGEVREYGKMASGNFMIQPHYARKPFEVACDLETRGGGWTVMQKRFDNSQDFNLNWQDYKNGFGNLGGEFWLGLENIFLLTGFEVNELLIELGDFELQNKSAFYSDFSIGSEVEGYSLKLLGTYSGNAGDSLTYSAGVKFSTKDNDSSTANCAEVVGAWWYVGCGYSNLNAKYAAVNQSISWYHFNNNYDGMKHTRMLVRPKVLSMNLEG